MQYKQYIALAAQFLLLFSLCSCSREMLSLYTEFFTDADLASFYVNTPDPLLDNPPFEQRLIVDWSIPPELLDAETFITLTIRFRNREEIEKWIPVKKSNGRYLFRLFENDFCQTGGILTYKAVLENSSRILADWKHQLWAELIKFEDTPAVN